MFVSIKQRVTPFERRAQRLLPLWCKPRAAGEQPKTVVKSQPQSFNAQQRQARGGELDGQRNAVQSATDFNHRSTVVVIEHKLRRGFARARREHRQCAETLVAGRTRSVCTAGAAGAAGRALGARIVRLVNRQRQRAQPQHLLVGELKRRLTGGEQRHLWHRPQQRRGQCGNGLDQMLAVVEHDQHLAINDARGELVGGRIRVERNREHARDAAEQQLAVAHRREINPPHAVRIVRLVFASRTCRRLREPSFAHAASTGDSD